MFFYLQLILGLIFTKIEIEDFLKISDALDFTGKLGAYNSLITVVLVISMALSCITLFVINVLRGKLKQYQNKKE